MWETANLALLEDAIICLPAPLKQDMIYLICLIGKKALLHPAKK